MAFALFLVIRPDEHQAQDGGQAALRHADSATVPVEGSGSGRRARSYRASGVSIEQAHPPIHSILHAAFAGSRPSLRLSP